MTPLRFIVSIIHCLKRQINENCNFTHETVLSLEMNNSSVNFVLSHQRKPLKLNHPICASNIYFFYGDWIEKHFWTIHITLTEQLHDPCRSFILLGPIEFHWTALIWDEMKDWVTLQARGSQCGWMQNVFPLLVYWHLWTPYQKLRVSFPLLETSYFCNLTLKSISGEL